MSFRSCLAGESHAQQHSPGCASNVARELVHIGNQLGFPCLCSDAADSLADRNPDAPVGALVGSNDQHGPVIGAQLVETLQRDVIASWGGRLRLQRHQWTFQSLRVLEGRPQQHLRSCGNQRRQAHRPMVVFKGVVQLAGDGGQGCHQVGFACIFEGSVCN